MGNISLNAPGVDEQEKSMNLAVGIVKFLLILKVKVI
jgi:hypothetical protein